MVAAVLVLALAAWAVSRVLTRLTGVGPEADPIIAERSSPPTAIRHISATLFSGSKDGETLVPHQQEVVLAEGIVPQGREIFPQLTVEENLRVGLGIRKNGARSIPERIFDLFPVLKQMLNRRGGDLSGGQQQQLAIGRALVLEPKMLILDEPTEGIQPNIVHEIGDIVLRLNKEESLTVLLVEQKLPFARRVASEFCILDKGRRVASGAIDELTDQFVRDHLSV
jgi:urea transport system ATP-binding protein